MRSLHRRVWEPFFIWSIDYMEDKTWKLAFLFSEGLVFIVLGAGLVFVGLCSLAGLFV